MIRVTAEPAELRVARVVCTPGVCGGRPRLSGTRIEAGAIVRLLEEQRGTTDWILAEYPSLTEADIRAAYQHERRAEWPGWQERTA